MDFLMQYAWIIWLAVILIFVIIEVVTVDFISLMLAVGSVGGLVMGLFRSPFWLQIVVAAIIALLLLLTVRPPLKRVLQRGGDRAKTLVDALPGQSGTVVLDFNGKPTLAKLANGETWTIKAAEPAQPAFTEGDRVVVTEINGSTAIVTPAERTANK
jgi:membrane protein implicated in regulation of membrane protease activity